MYKVVGKQFSSFAIIGVIATLIHYIILVILVELFSVDAVSASAVGYCISGLINYYLNYRYTFASNESHKKTLPKFATVSITGLGLNVIILMLLTEQLALHYVFSQVIATIIVLLWNFIVNKMWTFGIKNK